MKSGLNIENNNKIKNNKQRNNKGIKQKWKPNLQTPGLVN